MTRAGTQPLETSVTRTAAPPATVAPTIGMNPPRKVSRASGAMSGTPTTTSPIVIPAASASATNMVPRTYPVSVAHASRPAPRTRSSPSGGKRVTIQSQIRSPSWTKKNVENSVSRSPVTTSAATVAPESTPETRRPRLFANVWVMSFVKSSSCFCDRCSGPSCK